MSDADRIRSLTLDESSLKPPTPELEHERSIALRDLITTNHFALPGILGPYDVRLAAAGNRITFSVTSASRPEPWPLALPLAPFRQVIRDYFLICESYFAALKAGNMSRIEAIDMSRRALHNEGAALLKEALAGKAELDTNTARRLFTLVCVLHLK